MRSTGFRLMSCAAAVIATGVLFFSSCEKNNEDILAPYQGTTPMGRIIVQDSTLSPQVFWSGGFVSVFGVNQGTTARLDSTLVFLVRMDGNSVRYPVTVGTIPPGATNLSANYGGQSVKKLQEDMVYTFWVLKESAWSQLSGLVGKKILVDSQATSSVRIQNDTAIVSALLCAKHTQTADAFVNIKSIDPHGQLADMMVQETDTSNDVMVRFHVKQPGFTDTLVATIGLVIDRGTYKVDNVVWEVLSLDSSGQKPAYRTKNIIASPVMLGQRIPGTAVFTFLRLGNIRRNHPYYVWIATKEWDGLSRDSRTVPYYAWITFVAW